MKRQALPGKFTKNPKSPGAPMIKQADRLVDVVAGIVLDGRDEYNRNGIEAAHLCVRAELVRLDLWDDLAVRRFVLGQVSPDLLALKLKPPF